MSSRLDNINRRRLIAGATAATALATVPVPASAKETPELVSGDNELGLRVRPFDESPLFTEGARELASFYQTQYNGLAYGFYHVHAPLLSSPDEPEAFYWPKYDRVIVGDQLLKKLHSQDFGLVKLYGIFAHELAHVFQIKKKFYTRMLNVKNEPKKYIELHADYMAGQALHWFAQERPEVPKEVALMFYGYGDPHVGSSHHHGTHAERLISFAAGYHQFDIAEHTPKTKPIRSASQGILYIVEASGFN